MPEPTSGTEGTTRKIGKDAASIGWLGTILAVVVIGGGALAFTSIVVEDSWLISGDPSTYNPVDSYQEAADRAGEGAKFVGMEASMVKSDGTLDMNANYRPGPTVQFTFSRKVEAPDDAPPSGVTSNKQDAWHEIIRINVSEPGTMHQVTRTGSGGGSSYPYMNLGIKTDVSRASASAPNAPVSPPSCQLKKLWEVALRRGAPADAVSKIIYDDKGYLFTLELRESLELRFDQKCQLLPDRRHPAGGSAAP